MQTGILLVQGRRPEESVLRIRSIVTMVDYVYPPTDSVFPTLNFDKSVTILDKLWWRNLTAIATILLIQNYFSISIETI